MALVVRCKSCGVINLAIIERCKWCGSKCIEIKVIPLSEQQTKLATTGKFKLKE